MKGAPMGQIGGVALPGELRVVEDVPTHFADLVVTNAPASIAVSGGDLARACYEHLAARPFDWSEIDVFFGDDRFVPPEHDDSNEGMVRRVLLDHVQPRAVYPMYRSGLIDDAADAYDTLMREHPPIELAHLGVGPDGHTASLFPNSPALDVTDRLVVATGDELHPYPRITCTYPGIARSPFVVVTVTGADKRDVLRRIAAGEDLPAARIEAEKVLWLVDEAAAP
jgi:6-phosphogluconolactonase